MLRARLGVQGQTFSPCSKFGCNPSGVRQDCFQRREVRCRSWRSRHMVDFRRPIFSFVEIIPSRLRTGFAGNLSLFLARLY
jgi:hypothetical protein